MSKMRRALSLARRAQGSVSPNPAVGAVVVKDGSTIGEGWTQPPGGKHAEIVALDEAGKSANGAEIYVTLEPCNHHGRTPPCVDAILKAGISVVHVAVRDPNAMIEGSGVERLKEAGIRVLLGERKHEAASLLEAYIKWITTGTPFVTVKFAMSLDGKIATRDGDSKWITSDRSRRYVHDIRAISDAIMVGINTVLSDDPMLTARGLKGETLARQPMRVVVDSRLRIPEKSRVLSGPGDVIVASSKAKNGNIEGGQVVNVPSQDGSVDLPKLLTVLGNDHDVTSVFVEGGATLNGSLFDQGLVDKVIAFVAPTIIGGHQAYTAVGGYGVENMPDALRLTRVKIRRLGRDTLIIGYC